MGDAVFDQIGKWSEECILFEKDDGNPHHILLGDSQGTILWGPMDNDNFARRSPTGYKMDKEQIGKDNIDRDHRDVMR